MKAIILSIGDELISGSTVNTNAALIANCFLQAGINVIKIITIGDDEYDIIHELDKSSTLADYVVISGGLGPTHDDITKNVAAKYFNSNLELNNDAFERIKKRFKHFGREMDPSNNSQAILPHNAEIIPNDNGTAQGMIFKKNQTKYFFIPGVPFEMKIMMQENILPILIKESSKKIMQIVIHTFEIGESNLFSLLKDWINKNNDLTIAFLPHYTGVDIKITANGEQNGFSKALQELKEIAGHYIFGYDDDTMENIIGNLLQSKKMTLSVAESCTGGRISNLFTNIPGSSNFFMYGVTTYSNESKKCILKVKQTILDSFGAVSEQTAGEMAEGVRLITGCDIGISTTGIAGPTGGTDEKPVGTLCVGISILGIVKTYKFCFNINRDANKIIFSQFALNKLRMELINR